MEKLKTLKDIEDELEKNYNYEDTIPSPDIIRAEARKWYAHFQQRLEKDKPNYFMQSVIKSRMDMLNIFFNLGKPLFIHANL